MEYVCKGCHEACLNSFCHLVPSIILEAVANGAVQLLIGGLKFGHCVANLAGLSLGLFQISIQSLDSFTEIGTGCYALTTEYLLHDFTSGLTIAINILDGTSHLL